MDWSWRLYLGIHCFLSPGVPCKGVNYTRLRARGRCPLLIWSTLNMIRSTCPYLPDGRLTIGCRAVRLQVWHHWLILQTSLVLRLIYTSLETFLCTTLPIHTRHSHEPSKINVCWEYRHVLSFPVCFSLWESRISTWVFLTLSRKE